MLSNESIDSLINGNTRVHGCDLIIETVVLGEGTVGRHCGWLSFGLGKYEFVQSKNKDSKKQWLMWKDSDTVESN